jgi:hypothetical protein
MTERATIVRAVGGRWVFEKQPVLRQLHPNSCAGPTRGVACSGRPRRSAPARAQGSSQEAAVDAVVRAAARGPGAAVHEKGDVDRRHGDINDVILVLPKSTSICGGCVDY